MELESRYTPTSHMLTLRDLLVLWSYDYGDEFFYYEQDLIDHLSLHGQTDEEIGLKS